MIWHAACTAAAILSAALPPCPPPGPTLARATFSPAPAHRWAALARQDPGHGRGAVGPHPGARDRAHAPKGGHAHTQAHEGTHAHGPAHAQPHGGTHAHSPAHAQPHAGSHAHGPARAQPHGGTHAQPRRHAAPAQRAPPRPPAHLGPPPPLPDRYRAVALLPLARWEVAPELAAAVEAALLAAIDAIPGTRSVSPEDVLADLARAGVPVSTCGRDVSCLARAGRYARAHLAVEAQIGGTGGVPVVGLRLLDAEAGRERGRASARLAGVLRRDLGAVARRLVVQLLAPETYVGSLTVACRTEGAEVYLDDRLLGKTPLPEQVGLPAGLHVLRLSHPDRDDVHRFVDVVYRSGSTVEVDFPAAEQAHLAAANPDRATLGALCVTARPPDLVLSVDGDPVGITPLADAVIPLPAGARTLTAGPARPDGTPPWSVEVGIAPGLRTQVRLVRGPVGLALETLSAPVPLATPLPCGPPPPPPIVAPNHWRLYTGAALATVGLAGVGTGTALARNVLADSAEAARLVQATYPNLPALQRAAARLATLNARGPSYARLQVAAFAAGSALSAAGAGLLLWDLLRPGPQRGEVTVNLEAGAGGAAALTLRAPLSF